MQPQGVYMMPQPGMMGPGQVVFLPPGAMPPGMGAYYAPQPYAQQQHPQ